MHGAVVAMRCVVTGAAGFIGSNLVDRLLADGHVVLGIDDLSTGTRANLVEAQRFEGEQFTFVEISIVDEALAHHFDEFQPEVVFHLAAQTDVRVSMNNPQSDALINVVGTVNVCASAQRSGARRVVLAATAALFGDVDSARIPLTEATPFAPLAPYGVSKLAGVEYLKMFSRTAGLSTISLVLANVYGPRQGAAGEGGVVAIYAKALRDGNALVIFGDGTQTRDFVYVGDVVDAFVRAGSVSATQDYMFVGTSNETSVLELATTMRELSGQDTEIVHAPSRAGEIQRSALSGTRSKMILDWTPQTKLRDGLDVTIAALKPQS